MWSMARPYVQYTIPAAWQTSLKERSHYYVARFWTKPFILQVPLIVVRGGARAVYYHSLSMRDGGLPRRHFDDSIVFESFFKWYRARARNIFTESMVIVGPRVLYITHIVTVTLVWSSFYLITYNRVLTELWFTVNEKLNGQQCTLVAYTYTAHTAAQMDIKVMVLNEAEVATLAVHHPQAIRKC